MDSVNNLTAQIHQSLMKKTVEKQANSVYHFNDMFLISCFKREARKTI